MSVAIIENPKIFDANQVKQHAINLAVTTLAYENLKAQGNADRQIFENYIYELKNKGPDKVADIWPMCDGMLMMGFDLRSQDQDWNNALNNYLQKEYSHN